MPNKIAFISSPCVPYQKALNAGLSANIIIRPLSCFLDIIEAVFFISSSFSSEIYPLIRGDDVYRPTFAAGASDNLKKAVPRLKIGWVLSYPYATG